MKKLQYEAGHLVIRTMEGQLVWSSHWGDMKRSYADEPLGGGYKEIFLEGTLFEKSDYRDEDKTVIL